ncbi:hypothetical protein [Streptomyces orinoci]|uniref:Septum formation-related domain-containing protein n=1 Tax=Streptomyces orinoci TaxID=67339 RepID=A0ABV3JX93_STRON|nr:hypothetical protein [Streptomyces orinoci]
MTTPPPPPPSNPPQPPGGGGGFGPPQGFGPLPPEQPPFGAQPPAGPPPYGPSGYGPYGPQPVPPAPSGGGGAKIAAIVVAVVLVAGLAVGGMILFHNSGKDDKPVAHASSSPSPVVSASPSLDNPAPTAPSTTPSTAPSSPPPLIDLKAGDCFDAPQLSPSLVRPEKRSCDSAHDGQVISMEKLEGTPENETEIKDKALALCKPIAEQRLKTIGDGRRYYYYALYPTRMALLLRGDRDIACAITLTDRAGGAKLTAPLPGES